MGRHRHCSYIGAVLESDSNKTIKCVWTASAILTIVTYASVHCARLIAPSLFLAWFIAPSLLLMTQAGSLARSLSAKRLPREWQPYF